MRIEVAAMLSMTARKAYLLEAAEAFGISTHAWAGNQGFGEV